MDINSNMYIWVDTIFKDDENALIVDGNDYDNEFGFGSENRSYAGDFIQISKNAKVKLSGKIDIIHFTRGGFKWYISPKQIFLDMPFLLSSDLQIEHIYSGYIELYPSDDAIKTFAKFPNNSFSILSERCIGNLNIRNGEKFEIDIFSAQQIRISDLFMERFCFSGFEDSIGIIKID